MTVRMPGVCLPKEQISFLTGSFALLRALFEMTGVGYPVLC